MKEYVKNLCNLLKPILGSKIDEIWEYFLCISNNERKELINELELLAETKLNNNSILLVPPSEEEMQGKYLLGDVVYNNKEYGKLYLRDEDFIKQIGIFAITGSGKTNLAFLLALQLLKNKIPFLVIDWKRSWRSLLSLQENYPEVKEIVLFTIGRNTLQFLWNPFRAPPNTDEELWISTIAEVLEKSHISGPGVAYFFSKIYSKLIRKSKEIYPNFIDGLKELEKIKVYERELKWKQTALRILHSFSLESVRKVFNARVPVKLETLLNKPVIFELDLEMPKPLRIFFTEIILRWIHLYRLTQGETTKLRHVLFLEEVHNLFPKTKFEKEMNNSLENVYREIRAFGQGIVSITQHPSLLPIYILGNCHTQIYLALQHEQDITTARKAMFLAKEQEHYFEMLKTGEAIVKIKERINPCLVKIPLVKVEKGKISDEWLRLNYVNRVNNLLLNNINEAGFLHSLIEDRTEENQGYLPGHNNIEKDKGKKVKNLDYFKLLLQDIALHPLSSITQRYKRLSLNPKIGNKYKNMLIAEGIVKPISISLKNCRIVLFELTHKGRIFLRDLGVEVKEENEGIVHKFWKYKIADLLKKSGIRFELEAYKNGKPDLSIELNNKKIAIEIETGNSDIAKSIDKAKHYDLLIIIPTDKNTERKIRKFENKNIKIIPAKKYESIIPILLSHLS